MPQNITLRAHLSGSILEFSQNSKLSLISNPLILVELIVLLARYQEEGIALTPKVYMTNDIDTLNSMIPNGESIKIGMIDSSIQGIQTAIKKCAPLAIDNWLIYITEREASIEYGLFRDSGSPLNVLIDEVIMTLEDDSFIVVKAFQIAHDCVEIRSSNKNLHYIFLNHKKEESPPPQQYLDNLIHAITAKTSSSYRESTSTFLRRLMLDSLGQSHGCIIAVTNMRKVPAFISKDGIVLDEPIDFSNLVEKLMNKEINSSVLVSKGSLFRGMLNSDGIILFNDKGCLLGYNFFVKFSATNLIGGARKRAYRTVESKINKGICAVFMQSQDGWTDFKGIENE